MSAVNQTSAFKRKHRGPERITPRIAVETWGRRALLDLYLVLSEIETISVPVHLYFLAQGLEKLGKAYLIATQAARFEHLPVEEAIQTRQCAQIKSRQGISHCCPVIARYQRSFWS